MLQIKVHGQTPKSGRSICYTCKNAAVVKGQNCEEIVICETELFRNTGKRVPFKVAECTKYHPSTMPWLHEMEDMAWKIEAKKRGPVGFSEPEPDSPMEIVITKPSRNYGLPSDPTE